MSQGRINASLRLVLEKQPCILRITINQPRFVLGIKYTMESFLMPGEPREDQ